MESKLPGEIEGFRKEVTAVGEDIVFRVFPSKIIELTELIQKSNDPYSPIYFHKYYTRNTTTIDSPPTKKRKQTEDADEKQSTPSITIPPPPCTDSARQGARALHNLVKQEAETLVSLADQVRLWVAMTMPRIEDGDNFGVQVQEEVLAELHRAVDSAQGFRDTARQDFLARGKICSKIIALVEHEERQIYLARRALIEIRNIYAMVTDLIHKNIAKASSSSATVYRAHVVL
ncbi:hypothetical protein AX16_000335 [Volvariella volvacea WC 439]|nr:hypothetical protein AX16_000335 [Volvariella volvacea WC 439]